MNFLFVFFENSLLSFLMKIIKDRMTNARASSLVCGSSRVVLTEGASREGWLPRAAGAAVLGGSDISYALFVQVSNVDNSAIKELVF